MNIFNYLRETRTELRHVSWPTGRQTSRFTVLVVVVSLIVAALLGFFDFVYDYLLGEFVLGDIESVTPPSAETSAHEVTPPNEVEGNDVVEDSPAEDVVPGGGEKTDTEGAGNSQQN